MRSFILVSALAVGCAAPQVSPVCPSAPASASASASAPAPASASASAPAPPAPAADPRLSFRAAYDRAAHFVYAGDFEQAAATFVAVIPELAKHPDSPDEFWAHNAMMMIREAQGDPAAALAENDQATLAAARGTWKPAERETLAYLKDRWHRAYLSRMLAEMRAGSTKQALVFYAESALSDYRARARPLGDYEDSIAILEAYFAALDGRQGDALQAAKRVDATKDDDLEDLYLVVVGLEAGGDHAAAEAVRTIMRKPGSVHIARAIMLRWLDADAQPAKGRAFTPWHPITQ